MRVTWRMLSRAILLGGLILPVSCDSPPVGIDSGPAGQDSGPPGRDSGALADSGPGPVDSGIDGGQEDAGMTDADGGMMECTSIFDTSTFDSSCFGD